MIYQILTIIFCSSITGILLFIYMWSKSYDYNRMLLYLIFIFLIVLLLAIAATYILLSIFLVRLISTYSSEIAGIISHPIVLAPAALIGLFFYRLRSLHLFLYGFLELSAAIAALQLSIEAPEQSFLPKLVGILSGLYIMVRGLDNMDRGLPGNLRYFWDRVFPKYTN